ncbi:protein broad-minded isoform X2 [Synchiropus splendidus]|nr:protein broad-minded isoform X2 [Synchiropus splendidus]XP_053736226.1 protein broad-minded isoform X2 [Synchiropus splendidus]XP_053736227.1 protein broad-minded isoform X2 [Synchiropus splendidus]
MSQLCFSVGDVELQTLLKQFLSSISDRVLAAPSSLECAEEILLQLEETDENFHNYEFVKFLRQHLEASVGLVVEEETRKLTGGDRQHAIGAGHDTLIHTVTSRTRESQEYQQMMHSLKTKMSTVVDTLVQQFEEDQLKKECRDKQQFSGCFTDSCSDSDSSFNQSYTFIRQEQLQVLADNLSSSKPKQVRGEALQVLCCAPPSDVLSCVSWSGLRSNLCATLGESDPELSEGVLQFFAKSLSSSPFNVTREIYTSLATSLESSFLSLKPSVPFGSAGTDINSPEISSLLKQIRLMNDFQKEVTTFWIRHPEMYMEEIIESTFSLLTLRDGSSSLGKERAVQPIHLLALLDVKATWFRKWMHGFYSRTVVLRLLEKKYKSLIVASVQQCIHFLESGGTVATHSTDPQAEKQQASGSVPRSVYTTAELDYALFVHSLCVLGKLLLYKNGRKLFPIQMETRKEPVSLTSLIVLLIDLVYQHPKPLASVSSDSDWLSPSRLVMEVLGTLCERSQCAAECLHQSAVMETLLAPLIALLSGQQAKLESPAVTLTLAADILARIANTDGGLSLFLYQKNLLVNNSERSCPARIVVQFTLKLLDNSLPGLKDPGIPHGLCGAFIFVCRQMYNTCEGLQVLRPYDLHRALAAAWETSRLQSEPVPTPVPGAVVACEESQNVRIWEETLLDSLLNFAVTPRGLVLLQQTGALDPCVAHMFSRFTRGLQVSRCEKFGYGVMVTQVAATAPGAAALLKSGFVRALVVDLWSTLEFSSEDARVVGPKSTSMEPIDRSCLKSFLSLVNMLSSAQSVWELAGRQALANKTHYSLRETPGSLPDLLDRLIAVNSDAKIHSLFHYEQSHTLGLRLLSVLCCNLDSFLLLETQYHICSMLLQSQRENVTEQDAGGGKCIVDVLSVERNHVLVRVGVVGGPSERSLPPRALQEGEDPYPWPMFSFYPPPSCYTREPPQLAQASADPDISSFLSSSETSKHGQAWMEDCRRLYRKVMTVNPDVLTGHVLADLLEMAVDHLSATESFFSEARLKAEERSARGVVLSSVELLGMDICLRYGRFLGLLTDDAAEDLTLLMKTVKMLLTSQRVQTASTLVTLQDGYLGHDWLLSTVFLLMGGARGRSLSVLLSLSTLLTSAFMWPARIHASVHLPAEVSQSGIPPVYWCTAHYVEMLLKAEVPLVHSAFRMSGFTPSQMCLHWLGQCFWNYLDWPQICHYVSTCVLMGADYQVYVCVAIFKHLQPDILLRTQSQELQLFLKQGHRMVSFAGGKCQPSLLCEDMSSAGLVPLSPSLSAAVSRSRRRFEVCLTAAGVLHAAICDPHPGKLLGKLQPLLRDVGR